MLAVLEGLNDYRAALGVVLGGGDQVELHVREQIVEGRVGALQLGALEDRQVIVGLLDHAHDLTIIELAGHADEAEHMAVAEAYQSDTQHVGDLPPSRIVCAEDRGGNSRLSVAPPAAVRVVDYDATAVT